MFDFVFYEVKLYDFNNKDFSLTIGNLRDRESQTYKSIKNIFKEIIVSGYIRYVDAYSLALEYINKYENIKYIFSFRFKYVFIDEAQDTSALQKEIIEKCFNENVIIQWVGDVNQGIMQNNYEETAWKPNEGGRYEKMTFSTSYRISQPIADIVKNIAINKYSELNGNQDISIKPIIIVFDDNSQSKVLEKFSELLVTKTAVYDGEHRTIYEISNLTGNLVKAIGWVGKEKEKGLSIKSYFPDFDKQLTNSRKQYFPNLFTMCEISKNTYPKEFKDRTLACIIQVLSLAGKRYNKTEFVNLLKEQYPEQNNILFESIVKY
ncbi:MAG: UvrD-helicase domain-containing protein, partial [Candidatus Calescibacterium sp.]|nr:UvrD-helicase domain-containing protein [Candidatus Calescibacterium sp.]